MNFWNGQVLCLQQKRHALDTKAVGCELAVKSEQKTGVAIGWRNQLLQQLFVWMDERYRLAEDCAPSRVRMLLGFRLSKSVLDAMDGTNEPF